ncbi:hypothetical protein DIS24_g11663 [Lasiodiplodia hormozganensis]|uniref:C2H2-type domain-containing protein n=1 Tax=Lasiodiplodia hormozganensis TaxID=869390 RepID=A0AA39WNL3_9PEZI|nr:hypothetical protein DIS24_g11663 [Lasiodiplodia hormozganensis]
MVARAPKSGHRPGLETTCPHCPSTFTSELLCIQHVKTTHPGLKPFACPHGCSKTFTGKQQMLKHAANDVCGLKDMPASALNTTPPRKRKHQRNTTSFGSSPTRYREKKPLVYSAPGTQGNEASCAHCPADDPDNVFRSEMMMVLHVKAVHGRDVKPFPCLAGCGRFFTLKRSSTSHSVKCPGAWKTVPGYENGGNGKIKFERSGSSASVSAGSSSNGSENAAIPTHSHRGMARTGIDGFPEECDRCGMEFSRRSNLLRHQKQGACKGVWKANKPVKNRVDMALINWSKKAKEAEEEEAEEEKKEEKEMEEDDTEKLLREAFAEEEEEEESEEE